MKVVKVTSKGQVTIPAEIRAAIGISENSHLEVTTEGQVVQLRKLVRTRALGSDDPIWTLVGAGSGDTSDGSDAHDRHIAAGEVSRWRGSS